jgi:hypothetical protein
MGLGDVKDARDDRRLLGGSGVWFVLLFRKVSAAR